MLVFELDTYTYRFERRHTIGTSRRSCRALIDGGPDESSYLTVTGHECIALPLQRAKLTSRTCISVSTHSHVSWGDLSTSAPKKAWILVTRGPGSLYASKSRSLRSVYVCLSFPEGTASKSFASMRNVAVSLNLVGRVVLGASTEGILGVLERARGGGRDAR